MRDNAGEFVFIFGKGDHLASYVYATAREREGVHVVDINDEELKMEFGRRHDIDQSLTNTSQVASYVLIINDAKVTFEVGRDRITERALQFRRKQVSRKRWDARRLALRLCERWDSGRGKDDKDERGKEETTFHGYSDLRKGRA